MPIYNVSGTALNVGYTAFGNQASALYNLDGSVIPTSPSILKVATYNVGNWYIGSGTNVPTDKKTEYINLQQDILRAINADVYCFQEYWSTFCADGTLASDVIGDFFNKLETTNAGTTYAGHGIATNGVTLNEYTSYAFEHKNSNYPSYEKAYINVGGRTIAIFNTHLGTQATGLKEPQSQEIFNAVQNEQYFILMGDFNTGLDDFDTIMAKFIDAGYNSANYNSASDYIPTFYDSTSPVNGKPLDQIITSSNIMIEIATTNNIKLTDSINDKIDHIPLIAELQIN